MTSPRRKMPTQERAKATVAAILEATAQVLREEGAGTLSTNKVAKRAGVSIGSLYQYFPNKEALVQALARRRANHHLVRLQALVVGVDMETEAFVDRALEALIEVVRPDPKLQQALTIEIVTRGMPTLLTQLESARNVVEAWIRARDVPVEDPKETAWLLVVSVSASVHAALLSDPAKLEDPAFRRSLSQLVLRVLGRG